ncbi:CLUMA_CG004979, isoform A [Clunio marinus]|uniref:CLUMA_CG004979, isoform A n=1 Tax=Clunio marinus TaxID=568069 RepID=A0A1J1HTB8_9DIPT|nr:CLUMA_CG004979, isoform A [Clunio marinus]
MAKELCEKKWTKQQKLNELMSQNMMLGYLYIYFQTTITWLQCIRVLRIETRRKLIRNVFSCPVNYLVITLTVCNFTVACNCKRNYLATIFYEAHEIITKAMFAAFNAHEIGFFSEILKCYPRRQRKAKNINYYNHKI